MNWLIHCFLLQKQSNLSLSTPQNSNKTHFFPKKSNKDKHLLPIQKLLRLKVKRLKAKLAADVQLKLYCAVLYAK